MYQLGDKTGYSKQILIQNNIKCNLLQYGLIRFEVLHSYNETLMERRYIKCTCR